MIVVTKKRVTNKFVTKNSTRKIDQQICEKMNISKKNIELSFGNLVLVKIKNEQNFFYKISQKLKNLNF